MKRIFAVLLAITLIGCAGVQPKREHVGKTFTSDYPPLNITLMKSLSAEIIKKRSVSTWHYNCRDGSGMNISIVNYGGGGKQFDYYYSLEQIAANSNFFNLGAVAFGNHEWLKFADISSENKFLRTGYFTRKDDYFIYVYRWVTMDKQHLPEVEKFQKSHELTDYHRQMLNEAFEATGNLFKIKF